MKIKLHNIGFALLFCALLGSVALAGVKSKHVVLAEDITVGDTLVKQGTYKVAFDDQAKEVQIIRDSKIIARAPASLEATKAVGKFKPSYTLLKVDDKTKLLFRIDVGGQNAVVNTDRIAAARASSSAGQ